MTFANDIFVKIKWRDEEKGLDKEAEKHALELCSVFWAAQRCETLHAKQPAFKLQLDNYLCTSLHKDKLSVSVCLFPQTQHTFLAVLVPLSL